MSSTLRTNLWIAAITLCCLALQTPSASTEDGIPLIGLDRDGHSRAFTVPQDRFTQILASAARAADASLLSAVSDDRKAGSRQQGQWNLSMILIGLSIEVEAGIGPLGSLKASPQINLVYSNHEGPAAP